jgi:hypothetical protein
MAIDRTSATEYGGARGIIPNEEEHELSSAERALLLRVYGKKDYNFTEHKVPDEDGYIYPSTPLVNPERDRVLEKMNGYTETDI